MAAKGSTSISRKQLILSAICKHFSLDPKSLPENIAIDEVTSLYSTVLKSAKKRRRSASERCGGELGEICRGFSYRFLTHSSVIGLSNADRLMKSNKLNDETPWKLALQKAQYSM
ncbi:hypothetical protein ACFX13_002017 [Malus domestica]